MTTDRIKQMVFRVTPRLHTTLKLLANIRSSSMTQVVYDLIEQERVRLIRERGKEMDKIGSLIDDLED